MNSTHKYRNPKPEPWQYLVFLLLTGVIFSTLLLVSCSPKLYPEKDTNSEHTDSVYVKKERYDSLIYVPIPLENNQVIAHLGDTSRLETSIARSEAYIGGDGFLHHSLENKSEKTLPVVVPVYSKTIYTGVTDKRTETITKIEYIEKPLSWWQKFRLRAFWWLSGLLVLALLWIFRKPIIALIKKLI